MKQRLATEGWAALEFLESRYKRGNFDAPENEALDAYVKKARPFMKNSACRVFAVDLGSWLLPENLKNY